MGGIGLTPEAGRVAVAEAADRPYEQAVEHLRRDHRLSLSKQTLERMAESVGSYWLWNMACRNFDKAVQVLDFYHLSQHVHGCAQAFYGEGTEEARRWSLEVCGTLRAGQVESALERVEGLAGRSKVKRKAKHTLVTYLSNNRGRMDYPRYEAMGLPIGSGPVEAQCKVLVQARCKQAGMRWKKAGLEALLRVRCAVRDGSYEQRFGHWPVNFTAWNTQRRKAA